MKFDYVGCLIAIILSAVFVIVFSLNLYQCFVCGFLIGLGVYIIRLGTRIDWKHKIIALTTNEQEYIVADGFVQQSAARVAAYKMGFRLTQQTRKDRKRNLYLNGRI